MKPRLLIVEDDPNLGEVLSEYLALKGYDTTLCRDGEEGKNTFNDNKFDLCILDVMMPRKDGFTLAKEIRAMGDECPIIFLTAKSMQQDVIKGFNIGADDYLTKPFGMEELLVRIQAVLRRTAKAEDEKPFPEEFCVSKLKYYHVEGSLETPDGLIKLTTKENELLKIFLENLNNTVQRSYALNRIWKDDSYFNARSMDVYIAKLRKYISSDPDLKILTVHREGFKLVKLK